MKDYVDPKTHMAVKDYVWKNYHDSYDHNNVKVYEYNWIHLTAKDQINMMAQKSWIK